MTRLTELRERIAGYLRSSGAFPNAEILAAYPGRERDTPLKRAAVAVGIDGVELVPAGMGAYLGEAAPGSQPLYGATAEITLRFDLYCPVKEPGDRLHALFEALCESLILAENPFGVTKLASGEIAFDQPASANRMTARGTLAAAMLREGQESGFAAVRISPPSAG